MERGDQGSREPLSGGIYMMTHTHAILSHTCRRAHVLTHIHRCALSHPCTCTHTHVHTDPLVLTHTASLGFASSDPLGWQLPLSLPPVHHRRRQPPVGQRHGCDGFLCLGLDSALLALWSFIFVLLLPSSGAPLGKIRGLLGWSDIIPQPQWPLGPVSSSSRATLVPGAWRLLQARRGRTPALWLVAQANGWNWGRFLLTVAHPGKPRRRIQPFLNHCVALGNAVDVPIRTPDSWSSPSGSFGKTFLLPSQTFLPTPSL